MAKRLAAVGGGLFVLLVAWLLVGLDREAPATREPPVVAPESTPADPPSAPGPAVMDQPDDDAEGQAAEGPAPSDTDSGLDEATTDSGQEPVPNEILFLSQEGLDAAVEDVWPELHGCFEAAKQVDPEALDLVLLGFEVEEVDGVGRITGAVQALGPDAPGFLDCLVSWTSGFAFEVSSSPRRMGPAVSQRSASP